MENAAPLRRALCKNDRKWRYLCLAVILYNLVTNLGLVRLYFLDTGSMNAVLDLGLLAAACPMLLPALFLAIFDASDTLILILTLALSLLPMAGWLLFDRQKPLGAWLIFGCGCGMLFFACLLLFLSFFLLGAIGAYYFLQLAVLLFVSIFMLISLHKWSNALSQE